MCKSYKDLPLNLYHIQWKFRDEVRPRFGTMRGREFLMKDAYSFDLDEAGATQAFYRMFVAYLRTFHRMGLDGDPDARRHRPDRRRPELRVPSSSPTPARARVFLDKRPARQADPGASTSISAGDLTPDLQGLDVAVRRHRRDDRRSRASGPRSRRATAARGARHRGRPHLLFRHQVFRSR